MKMGLQFPVSLFMVLSIAIIPKILTQEISNNRTINEQVPIQLVRILRDMQGRIHQLFQAKDEVQARFDHVDTIKKEFDANMNETIKEMKDKDNMLEDVLSSEIRTRLDSLEKSQGEANDTIQLKLNKLENQLGILTDDFKEQIEDKLSQVVNTVNSKLNYFVAFTNKSFDSIETRVNYNSGKLDKVVEEIKKVSNIHDCCFLRISGFKESKVYKIHSFLPVTAQCDMELDGGGWTVIQKGTMNGVNISFDRNWHDYENGFGDSEFSHWLGLKYLSELTKNKNQEIRFEMKGFDGTQAYAKYSYFHVAGASEKYKLGISGYSGTAGDSMTESENLNGMLFSTKDKDNDKKSDGNCAESRQSGWWHNWCTRANPNGILYTSRTLNGNSVFWETFIYIFSLKSFEIKIRNKEPALCGVGIEA